MIRGVERRDQEIRILGTDGAPDGPWLDWRQAEKLALDLLQSVRFARDRELAEAGREPGLVVE